MKQSVATKKRGALAQVKKGFTLIEIIIVVLIIAVLVGLFYPSIMSNKDKATISATVGNDVKLIAGAITEWKNSSSTSDGSYANLTTAEISTYLPSGMIYDSVADVVKSSGLNSGVSYQVLSDKINSNGDSFKVYIDFTAAANANNYNARMKNYAEKTAADQWVKISTDKANTSTDTAATALGAANDVFTGGGAVDDGLSGTRNIVF